MKHKTKIKYQNRRTLICGVLVMLVLNNNI
jgi:hypothetical protein